MGGDLNGRRAPSKAGSCAEISQHDQWASRRVSRRSVGRCSNLLRGSSARCGGSSQVTVSAVSNHFIKRVDVLVGQLVLVISFVVRVVGLYFLIGKQDDGVALALGCPEEVHFCRAETIGRLRKHEIGRSIDLFNCVATALIWDTWSASISPPALLASPSAHSIFS